VNQGSNVKRRPLIEGRRMRCPRCKRLHDILQYVPLMEIEEFATETNPIYKCPTCRWMFSPSPHILEVFAPTDHNETRKS
jgi:DNA-directed RNA polymerase subunit RPC12/RpoP